MTDRKRSLQSHSRRAFLRVGTAGIGAMAGLGIESVNGVEATGRAQTGEKPEQAQLQGTWREGPAMPDRRTEVGAAALDGDLYVVGGFVPDGVTAGVAVFAPAAGQAGSTTGRERADGTTGEARGGDVTGAWSTADPLPEPRHHAGVVALDGDLYVVGGFRGRGFDPVDSVWRYDGTGWQERGSLPTPRGALAAGVVDGRIYAAGGEDADGSVGTLAVYDPSTDEWTGRAEMPTARNHLAAGVVDGTFYAVGGRTSFSNLLDATEAYDPDADEWESRAPMPTARGGLSGTTLDGRVFAVGGEGPGGTFEEVEAYDPGRDEWARVPPLPTPRHGLGVSALDGDLYTVAGGPDPGFAFSDALEVFSPSEDEATTGG